MLKNVKCARCVKCGKEYEAVPNLTNCECGGILDIIYDYDYIKANLTKEKLKSRPNTMWRYRELLPVEVPPVLPLPAKKSQTTAPGLVCVRIARSSRSTGFCVGWIECPPVGSFDSQTLQWFASRL